MSTYRKPICGIGINDADYFTSKGGKIICPYYKAWHNMINRAYSLKHYKSYRGVTVHKDWHTFSVFKAWMETQDWEGKQLDKDLRGYPNKIYSPDTCLFLLPQANGMLVGISSERYHKGSPCQYLRGVNSEQPDGTYTMVMSKSNTNPEAITVRGFKSEVDAHNHWRFLKASAIRDNIHLFDEQHHKYVVEFYQRYTIEVAVAA